MPQSWASRRDIPDRPQVLQAPEAPVPFWSAANRAALDQGFNSNEGGREGYFRTLLLERHREIERLTGQRIEYSEEMLATQAFGADMVTDEDPYGADAGVRRQVQAARPTRADYEARVEHLRRQYPQLAGVATLGQLEERLERDLTRFRTEAQAAGAGGVEGALGSFVGGTGAALLDTPNALSVAATGGLGAGRPLLARMVMQGAAGAGTEVLTAPGRAQAAQAWGGPDFTGADAARDVLFAGVGGAGFEGLGAAGMATWRALAGRMAGSADAGERGLSNAIERLMDDEAALAAAPDFDAARAALAMGEPRPSPEPDLDLEALFADRPSGPVSLPQPELPGGAVSGVVSQPQPGTSAVGGLVSAEYRGRRIWAGQFDPLALETDAARFQYKAAGDAAGVTTRLRGIEQWDATASGKALVFEDLDGRRIVADGHQRRGLAARLAGQGFEDARLDGYMMRAADGWTAREVRVVAALKNLREGSGSIMDAAKLFREAPGALRDRSLPVTGEFIQQARQLAGLSDEAFRAVTSGVIPERYGAVLGEMAGDRPELQGQLVEVLRKGEPGSTDGARALVQEALLDDFIATEGVQLDLFGGLPRESTLFARARIREQVMGQLRRDQRLNGLLVRHADAIEAGGNVLATDANAQRLAIDRAAGELVSRLALRSGEMGEAFADAARAVTVGETTPGKAAKGLVARIRAAVKAGEDLDAVRAERLNPAPPPASALEAAKGFDTPAGVGQKAQLEPKPEDVEVETAAAAAGLFDDLPDEEGALDRALKHLTACAPGRA